MKRDLISKVSLHLFRVVQTLWALSLLTFVTPLIVRGASHSIVAGFFIMAIVIYVVASCAIFMDYRWSWILSIAFLAGYWFLHGWMALVNFAVNVWMFFSGHELYKDSPATIIIVFLSAIFGIFPATCLLVLGALARKRIISILRGRPMHESDHHPPVEAGENPTTC